MNQDLAESLSLCYNRIRLINIRHLSHIVLEAGKSKIKADVVSLRAHFLIDAVTSWQKGARESFWGLFL